MVTRQQQVERRTAKVCLSETDVLPLCHANVVSIMEDLYDTNILVEITLFVSLVLHQAEVFSCVETAANHVEFPVEVTGSQSVDQTSSSRYLYTWSLSHSF